MKYRKLFLSRVAMTALFAAALGSHFAIAANVDLSDYYRVLAKPPGGVTFPLPFTTDGVIGTSGFPPEVRVVGGDIDPPGWMSTTETAIFPVNRLFILFGNGDLAKLIPPYYMQQLGAVVGPNNEPCGTPWSWGGALPKHPLLVTPRSGTTATLTRYFRSSLPTGGCSEDTLSFPIAANAQWTLVDTYTLQAPIRRKASDGSEYDASPLVVLRSGVPWITYYFGYRMGLVGSQSNWLESNLSKVLPAMAQWPAFPSNKGNFELAKLPAPYVEGEIVEYVNFQVSPASALGHYFYASGLSEQALLDDLAAWSRTGKTFKSGGYVSVCRHYFAGTNATTGTHFYSADSTECEQLKGTTGFQYEGQVFRASRPVPSVATAQAVSCPRGTQRLYRFYNNASGKNYANNHRYVIERVYPSEAVTMVAAGWRDEGPQMCVPDAP